VLVGWQGKIKKRPGLKAGRLEIRRELLFLFLLIALLADLFLFGRLSTALVLAFLACGNRFVAAAGVLLALFAGFLVLVRIDAALVLAILPFGLGGYATALAGED
jgi:hypothetical protein